MRDPPALVFVVTKNCLQVRARTPGAAVTYEEYGDFSTAEFALPLKFLGDCQAECNDSVDLEVRSDNTVLCRWSESDVPQAVVYERQPMPDLASWPQVPSSLAQNTGGLLVALRDASQTSDSESSRYALGHIQLRGNHGEIAATDGRQLLLQGGFSFPWQENLLIPANDVFGRKELLGTRSISIGFSDGWVAMRVGAWVLQFRTNEIGRFPSLEGLVPLPATAIASCKLPQRDLQRLQRCLWLLPGKDQDSAPVTMDLGQTFVIRAQAAGIPEPVDLMLSGEPCGEPTRIATDRKYLQRAADLGLRELHLFGPEQAVLARDERRSYLWMPLASQFVVQPEGKNGRSRGQTAA